MADSAIGFTDHTGFCDVCKRIADEITQGDPVLQLRMGNFAKVWRHRQAHQELVRWRNIRRGIWGSLPAFLNKEELAA